MANRQMTRALEFFEQPEYNLVCMACNNQQELEADDLLTHIRNCDGAGSSDEEIKIMKEAMKFLVHWKSDYRNVLRVHREIDNGHNLFTCSATCPSQKDPNSPCTCPVPPREEMYKPHVYHLTLNFDFYQTKLQELERHRIETEYSDKLNGAQNQNQRKNLDREKRTELFEVKKKTMAVIREMSNGIQVIQRTHLETHQEYDEQIQRLG
ncbi:hypothetical protein L5515_005869 [Caenorhabditis briggsae]|uniref:Uncharacterized protein n=1 Tax=Caenorhabditis briggsae TaxID=6238 RepID=A0AAE9EUH3_CAEBR|nr:hypothetical protein L5515_005869 [Caenorhabditis briggsae]